MGYIVKRPTDVKHENKQYNTYNIRVKKTHSRTDKYKHTLRQKKDKDNNNNNKNFFKKKGFFFVFLNDTSSVVNEHRISI